VPQVATLQFHHRPRALLSIFHHRPCPTWCTHFQPWLICSDLWKLLPTQFFYLTTILIDCPRTWNIHHAQSG
jgi:hypothetical protein